uniref:Uncharacterized protein n=1 Tax=Plectus sambesii TaxID=2011161 RepID=A0A914VCA8_9BILA
MAAWLDDRSSCCIGVPIARSFCAPLATTPRQSCVVVARSADCSSSSPSPSPFPSSSVAVAESHGVAGVSVIFSPTVTSADHGAVIARQNASHLRHWNRRLLDAFLHCSACRLAAVEQQRTDLDSADGALNHIGRGLGTDASRNSCLLSPHFVIFLIRAYRSRRTVILHPVPPFVGPRLASVASAASSSSSFRVIAAPYPHPLRHVASPAPLPPPPSLMGPTSAVSRRKQAKPQRLDRSRELIVGVVGECFVF